MRATALYPVPRQAGILHALADDAVDAFVAELDTMQADRGTVLFRQGDPGDYLYVVLAGKVKLAREFGPGMERFVALLGPGDQFGEPSLLDPGARNSTATVVAGARFARLHTESLKRWSFQRSEGALRIFHMLARSLRGTNSDLTDTLFIDVPGRIAKQLLTFARRFGVRDKDGIRVTLDRARPN